MVKVLEVWCKVSFSVLCSPSAQTTRLLQISHAIYKHCQRHSDDVDIRMLMEERREGLAKAQINGVAKEAEANQPIRKVGLAGAGSHSGPEGSWISCQVSDCRAITPCFIN